MYEEYAIKIHVFEHLIPIPCSWGNAAKKYVLKNTNYARILRKI